MTGWIIDFRQAVLDVLREPEVRDELRNIVREVLPPPPEDLRDLEGAAKFLNMTATAVRSASYRGSIPTVRVAQRLRFRRSDLLALTHG
jgi:hypothetical protein